MRVRKAFLDVTLGGRHFFRGILAVFAVRSFAELGELLHVAHAREVKNFECSGEVVFLLLRFFAAL